MHRNYVLRATHAFVRPPSFNAIPSTGPNGVVINRPMLLHQFRDFYKTLQQSQLVDKLHLMSERPTFESMKVADHMASIGASFVGMPLAGQEHRATEFMDSMRYIRGAGGPSTVASYLLDADNCRCHSGDIVALSTGLAIGHGPRTNAIAHQTLKSIFEFRDEHASFDVYTLEQEGDAPPLGDYFGFAGSNILLCWKDEHGMLAVDQYQQQRAAIAAQTGQPAETLQVVYLEAGCHFLSFFGTDFTPDVLVQRGYDRSIEALQAAGLNPIPVQWSEMDKMGVSMRSSVLLLKFLKSNVSGMLTKNVRSRSTPRWQAHQLTSGDGTGGALPPPSE